MEGNDICGTSHGGLYARLSSTCIELLDPSERQRTSALKFTASEVCRCCCILSSLKARTANETYMYAFCVSMICWQQRWGHHSSHWVLMFGDCPPPTTRCFLHTYRWLLIASCWCFPAKLLVFLGVDRKFPTCFLRAE